MSTCVKMLFSALRSQSCRLPFTNSRSQLLTCVRWLLLPPSGNPPITMLEVCSKLHDIVDAPDSVRPADTSEIQCQLPARKMATSYREACIPLGSNAKLRQSYVNIYNHVRFGKILEDLDYMAAYVSYAHSITTEPGQPEKSPLCIVTAMVDRIDLKVDSILPDEDILICGHVTWVGKSSMEVSLDVEQKRNGSLAKVIDATFLMVARDQQNKKALVNRIVLTSSKEKAYFHRGEGNRVQREQETRVSLLKTPPNETEKLLIHDLFLKTIDQNSVTFKHIPKPADCMMMEDTVLKDVTVCFPAERNMYHKIFGGFLMRKAFELAWANAHVYCKSKPHTMAVDDILFRKPVEIGSILYMTSQVVYTHGPFMQIKVLIEVMNPSSEGLEPTNLFHVTFITVDGRDVAKVIPKSYREAMLYLDGKRHYEAALKHKVSS